MTAACAGGAPPPPPPPPVGPTAAVQGEEDKRSRSQRGGKPRGDDVDIEGLVTDALETEIILRPQVAQRGGQKRVSGEINADADEEQLGEPGSDQAKAEARGDPLTAQRPGAGGDCGHGPPPTNGRSRTPGQ